MKKIIQWGAAAAILLTLVLCGVFIAHPKAQPLQTITVTPRGYTWRILEYGQDYEDPGAEAVYTCEGESVRLTVHSENNVDTVKVGHYLIRYTAEHNGVLGTGYRRVDVVDTVAPQITLVSDPERFTLPGQTYVEEGFSAADNYDGDLTAQVQRWQTEEKVYYRVSDSSGNTTIVERWIAYNDPTPPELTLNGDREHAVLAGIDYVDPGWTAIDNCDGDITGNVTVSGQVDIYLPGTYTLTYTVSDSYGNTVSAERNVTVIPQTPPEVMIPEGKVIYLTFDDGPGPRTPELLDLLARYDVKATFFVVNTAYIGTIKRAADEGHAIGIHTTTHKFDQIYASDQAYLDDLYNMQGIIERLTGQKTTLMRFPGGSSNTTSRRYNKGIMTRLTQRVVALGFQYFDWNVDSDDAGSARSAYSVFENVTNGIEGKQTAVVLQHDIKGYSIDAVERIINWGLSRGYTFLPLSSDSPGCHHPVNN